MTKREYEIKFWISGHGRAIYTLVKANSHAGAIKAAINKHGLNEQQIYNVESERKP